MNNIYLVFDCKEKKKEKEKRVRFPVWSYLSLAFMISISFEYKQSRDTGDRFLGLSFF